MVILLYYIIYYMHKNNYKVNENEYCFIHFPKSGGTTFNFYLNYF